MNRELAKRIVIETFESGFNKDKFIKFLKNLLKDFEEKTTFIYRGNYIPDAFEQYITSFERIGKYTDGENEIDLLIVKLKRESSLIRARTAQRNFIAWYLKGSRGGKWKDAALCAFVSPDSEDWRFSLIKIDYKIEETPAGKIKVKEEFTPAKRWSFLVGKNEKSHTAQSRFVPLLERDERPTLKDLEEAFNVETVTKEFFEKYRELFIRTKLELDKIVRKDPKVKKEFESKNINTVDFAKKLLGQIVFLYFLQKKGWFGVEKGKSWGTGPKDFMRRLFNKEYGDYKNFFNDILEPLFYEALRTDRSWADHYYSRFNCKIPFLNGGLFDPINNYDWVNTEITIPDDLFSNNRRTKEGDIGDGILDVFDRFNFTVNEEEPLEKEVALDPELLGKIYEKLNAIRPDNFNEYVKVLKSGKRGEEAKFNKEYGVYYTPREIVHYMCQESLINYLETELKEKCPREDIEKFVKFADVIQEVEEIAIDKEKKVKSGEQKTTKYESQLPDSIKSNAKEIDRLLADIKVCDPAVGSGAFPIGMMHEIVKLRRLLSLFTGKQKTNYELKRHCIENSLYGVDIDPGAVEICKLRFWLSLIVDEEDIHQIKPLPNLDYKVVCGDSLLGVEKDLFNNEAFRRLEKLKPKYFNETNPAKKEEIKKEIDKLIFEITKEHKVFDFEVYFSEVFHQKGGFDVVIANPPYGIIYDKLYKQQLLKNYSSFKRNNDIYIAFYECGLRLLKMNGILTYISPNTCLNGDYFKDFRTLLTGKTLIKEIFDFKELHIFETPTVFVCIICCQKQSKIKFPYKYKLKITKNSPNLFTVHSVTLNGPTSNSLSPENSLYLKLISEEDISLAGDLFYIKDVGFNYWTKGRGKKRGEGSIGHRVFYSGKQKNKKDIPFLKGRDISPYHIKTPTNFLVHDYHKHLNPHIDILRFTPSFLELKPKIVYRQTANKIIAALDINGYYLDKTVHLIAPKNNSFGLDIKYVLGLLNSSLLNYLYIHIAQEREGRTFAQVKTTYIKKLPIKVCTIKKQKPIIKLVNKILSLTQSKDYLENPQKQAKVKEYQRQIDQLVYKLYDLTEEEIKIIEEEIK